MYKILNFLFGWDYVAWANSADHGIARVYRNEDGQVYYFRYRITNVIDFCTKENLNRDRYGTPYLLFLTCHSDKYL